jgi:hypothetical protein
MSYAEIEAELDHLAPDELRQLALKSRLAFLAKEGRVSGANACHEDDPLLLAALDEALAKADATPGQGHTGQELRARLQERISK